MRAKLEGGTANIMAFSDFDGVRYGHDPPRNEGNGYTNDPVSKIDSSDCCDGDISPQKF